MGTDSWSFLSNSCMFAPVIFFSFLATNTHPWMLLMQAQIPSEAKFRLFTIILNILYILTTCNLRCTTLLRPTGCALSLYHLQRRCWGLKKCVCSCDFEKEVQEVSFGVCVATCSLTFVSYFCSHETLTGWEISSRGGLFWYLSTAHSQHYAKCYHQRGQMTCSLLFLQCNMLL